MLKLCYYTDIEKSLAESINKGLIKEYPWMRISESCIKNSIIGDTRVASKILDDMKASGEYQLYIVSDALLSAKLTPFTNLPYVINGLAKREKKVAIISIKQLKKVDVVHTAIHEVGHLFGLSHCQSKQCFMSDGMNARRNNWLWCKDCTSLLCKHKASIKTF